MQLLLTRQFLVWVDGGYCIYIYYIWNYNDIMIDIMIDTTTSISIVWQFSMVYNYWYCIWHQIYCIKITYAFMCEQRSSWDFLEIIFAAAVFCNHVNLTACYF